MKVVGCSMSGSMAPPWKTLAVILLSASLTALFLARPVGWVAAHLLCTRKAVWGGEMFRLLTGPLVHASWGHAARDLGPLLVLGLVWERALGRRCWIIVVLLSISVPALVSLIVMRELQLYFGLSAVTYGVLCAGLVLQWGAVSGAVSAAFV